MSDYLQPDFYRFNQDSLELVKWIKSMVTEASSILDLGAGSGVIGIELACFYQPQSLALVELQPEFMEYLQHNARTFAPATTETEVVISSFADFHPEIKFDLIAINPPYFLPGRGETSSDLRKHQCRTFSRDNWQELSRCIKRSLKPSGQCFIVLRQDPHALAEVKRSFSSDEFKLVKEEKRKAGTYQTEFD